MCGSYVSYCVLLPWQFEKQTLKNLCIIIKTFIKNNLLAEILSLPLYHYNYHLSKIYPETHLKLFLSIHRGTGRTRTQDVRGGTGPLQKVLLTFSLIPMSRGYRRIVTIF